MVKVKRLELVDCLEKAKRAMASKTSLPSLKYYLMEIQDNRLHVHSSNLDWGISLSIEAEGDDCSFLAPSLLLDVIKSLRDDVTLAPDLEAFHLTVKSEKGETVLNILSPEDFPKMPEVTGKSFTIDAQLLSDLVDLGSACAVKNPARPLWGAVCFTIQDRKLELVSTDQFSLSIAESEIEAEDLKFLVTADLLREVSKLMSGQVAITVGESMVSFACDTARSYIRLLDGQYYSYKQVIPAQFPTVVETDRKSLVSTVTRASLVASEEDRAVRLIVDGSFTVKAGSGDKGRMEEQVESQVSGDPVEVWLQHTYLSNALRKLDSPKVTVGISGGLSPMKVSGSNKGFFIIMPMSTPKGA